MLIDLEEAKRRIQKGEVIAVPTDTVWGLAASLRSEEAIEQLYQLKNRPKTHPLVVMEKDIAGVAKLCDEPNKQFWMMAKQFWPGALTLVGRCVEEAVPGSIRKNQPLVAFRIPKYEKLLSLLDLVGPLVVTSANKTTQKAATCLEEVEKIFGHNFPVLAEGQEKTLKKASTVVVFDDTGWKITREGAISEEIETKV